MKIWAVGAQLGMHNPERSLYLEVLLDLFCSHPFDVKCGTASCDRVVAKFLAFQQLVMDSMWLMYRLGGWKGCHTARLEGRRDQTFSCA